MHVQFLNSPAFAIDETGKLTRSAVWLLCCDTPQEDIAQLAEQWAGSVGSPWRVPDAAGESYLADNSMQITQINCKPLDSCSCEVTLYGTKVTAENSLIAIPGSFTFERRKDLSEYRSCRFKLRGSPEEILPVPGDLIAWAGNGYRCESVEVTGDPSGESVVCITAVNTSITGASDVVSESSSDFQQIKKGSWLILPDALEDFLAANKLHSAAPWAGKNYYVSHIKTQDADSANRTLVTLQARYADLKMIESLRHEEVVAMPTFYGSPKKLLVWTSVWRARPEDQMFFESMLGNNAGD